MLRWSLVLAPIALFGCPDGEKCAPQVVVSEVECSTTQDCAAEGYRDLSCVGGICRKTCLRDVDCVLPTLEDDDPCLGEFDAQKGAVCVDQLCQDACTGDGDCAGGQVCANGRCAYYFESFEERQVGTPVTLQNIGFNSIDKALTNQRNKIVWRGVPQCVQLGELGSDRCAGLASDGERFVLLESTPTPEKGTAETEFTCRACACCLDCIFNPPMQAPEVGSCPGTGPLPAPLMCPMRPAVCTDVCSACDACQAQSIPPGPNLLSCELDAAEKTCSFCEPCTNPPSCETCRGNSCGDACEDPASVPCADCLEANCPTCLNVKACNDCRNSACAAACSGGLYAQACKDCEATSCPTCGPCRDCSVCSDAAQCRVNNPGDADCLNAQADCNAQGDDGCYPAAIRYPRAQLFDGEQALVSPAIDLSSASGGLTLQLDYVAFNVGFRYRKGIQHTPATEWMEVPQEVVVQICASGCEDATDDTNWADAMLVGGGVASFPPTAARQNGQSVGRQGQVDWSAGRIGVNIPEDVRTAEFRFRLLPRLADATQVGIDHIFIRSRE